MLLKKERILVIRLGALGDLIFCQQAFHEIRQAHPCAEIALLTRPPFVAFAEAMPWFDRVLVDTYPTWCTPRKWLALRRDIRAFAPDRVYDFQGKRRQTVLFSLLGGPWGPVWSGAAPGCALPRPWPPAPGMHFMDFLAAQLRVAGVPAASPVELGWLDAPVERFGLPQKYAVLIPGCSPNAPHKRWPSAHFAALARLLHAQGLSCVLVGTSADVDAVEAIKCEAPDIVDLCAKTTLFELAGLLRRATVVVGNDTGPVHMAGALHVPTVALFSGRSSPVWSKPPGSKVICLQQDVLADLSVKDVCDGMLRLGVRP